LFIGDLFFGRLGVQHASVYLFLSNAILLGWLYPIIIIITIKSFLKWRY
jgi:hypothetical protein